MFIVVEKIEESFGANSLCNSPALVRLLAAVWLSSHDRHKNRLGDWMEDFNGFARRGTGANGRRYSSWLLIG